LRSFVHISILVQIKVKKVTTLIFLQKPINTLLHESYRFKADTLVAMGEFQNAVTAYDKSISIRKVPLAYLGKMEALYYWGKYNDVLKVCDQAIKVESSILDIYTYKANVYVPRDYWIILLRKIISFFYQNNPRQAVRKSINSTILSNIMVK
jgi:tetratricopeptide (TPR) repeat protein